MQDGQSIDVTGRAPLPRDLTRFRTFAPEPRAVLRKDPTPGFTVLTSIEMLYAGEFARARAAGGSRIV